MKQRYKYYEHVIEINVYTDEVTCATASVSAVAAAAVVFMCAHGIQKLKADGLEIARIA